MEFARDIKKLKDEDLPRYREFLFDILLGVISTEERRIQILDRIDEVTHEMLTRQGLLPIQPNRLCYSEHSSQLSRDQNSSQAKESP
jgi:hypothetical protein